MKQTTDGGYVVAGETHVSGKKCFYLLKTDSLGNPIFERINLGRSGRSARSVLEAAGGGFVVVGTGGMVDTSGAYITRVDAAGSTVWERGLDRQAKALTVLRTKDSGFVTSLVCCRADSGVGLVKTDSAGNCQWKMWYRINIGDYIENVSLRQTADGGYIMGAKSLIKVDSVGNQLWQKSIDGLLDVYSVLQTNDRGYAATGWFWTSVRPPRVHIGLQRTDSLGNPIWRRMYGENHVDVGYWVEQTRDSGYVVAGASGLAQRPFLQPYLVRTDSDGDEVWHKFLGGDGEVRCVRQTRDGGYIVTGTYSEGFAASRQCLSLTKLGPDRR